MKIVFPRARIAVLPVLLTFVALFDSAPAQALDPRKAITQYSHQIWQAREGLPQNSIHAMIQTRDGYLWLGTQEGLVRFDGVQFTVFDRSNSLWMRSNHVQALLEDRDGGLWVGTNGGGVTRWKEDTFFGATAREGLAGNHVNCLFQDRDGVVWVGTTSGLSRHEGGKFTSAGLPGQLKEKDIRAVGDDRHGGLWAGTSEGDLARLHGGRWTPVKIKGLVGSPIRALAKDREGNLWIGSEGGGLASWNDGAVALHSVSGGLSGSKILSVLEDSSGSLWIGTDGAGLSRLSNGKWATYSTQQGLSNGFVASLCEDREGSLWIGTHGGGLNRLSDGSFTRYGSSEGLTYDDISTFLEASDGSLWIGTWGGGVNRFKDGKVTAYSSREGLSYDEVSSLAEGRDGGLWIGTWGGGLNHLSRGRLRRVGTREGSASEKVTCLMTDRAGALWVGTLGSGISRFAQGRWQSFTTKQGLPSDIVRSIVEAPDGTFWIGTDLGLAHFDRGAFRRYGVADGLVSDAIYSLLVDREGILWVSTLGGGLHRFENGRFKSFTTAQGLFDSVIFQILDDDSGHLWMSSNRGVYRVAKSDLDAVTRRKQSTIPWRLFGTADGMESSECNGGNQPAGIRTRDGRLWFATLKGAVVVDPDRLSTNTVAPPVQLEEAIANKRRLDTRREARVPPGPGTLEFHYAGLSFLAPQKVRFRYRLEGFDKEWVDAGTRRAAYYTNTPPGSYRFRVIACNNDGVWNETGATFAFTLAPHIYQTRWFFSLCVGVLLFLATGLYRLRVQGLTRRKADLVRLVGERTRQLEDANQRLEQANRALRRLSSQDGLTGIANRRQFDEVLDLEWRRAYRAETPISLLMIDIDHFKAFNDAHGHQRGDDYLKAVAAALRDGLNRPGDLVARYGGEEFVVVLPGTDEEGANACSERLRSSVSVIEIPHDRPSAPLSATVSIGVATAYPREGSSSATLVAAADEALYRAKSEGRNRVRIALTVAV
jgi:diguanylate cyclase (GGDEF)-like protein